MLVPQNPYPPHYYKPESSFPISPFALHIFSITPFSSWVAEESAINEAQSGVTGLGVAPLSVGSAGTFFRWDGGIRTADGMRYYQFILAGWRSRKL